MDEIKIDTGNLERFAKAIETNNSMAQEAFGHFLMLAVAEVIGEISLRTPVDRGSLRNSWQGRRKVERSQIVGVIGTTLEYAPYVEYDTKPHWAPIAPLKEWARRKFGDESIGYAVRFAIAKHGTKGKYMAREGTKAAKPKVLEILRRGAIVTYRNVMRSGE